MSVGTSDTTVISSPNPEARNLNAIDASAAPRDDSLAAPKNRHQEGYIFLWNGTPISWSSRRQKSV